jgi:transcriptional regulator with XRE-family HTH domain
MSKDRAIELRAQGLSYSLIGDILGIPKSTLSHWLKDVSYAPNEQVLRRIEKGRSVVVEARKRNKLTNIARAKDQALKELGEVTDRDVLMLGIGLYIGEGSKSIESVRITNSDPKVIKLAMKWFRNSCGLSDSNFSLILFLYPDTDEKCAKHHWSQITQLPISTFRKTQIDRRIGKKKVNHGKLPFGTLQIRIKASGDASKGSFLFRKILAWTEAVST